MNKTTYLAEAAWPISSWWREVVLILGGSLLLALLAQVSFNIGPVPITGQTFGVLLIAGVLGRRGAASVLAYLMQGAMGLPVFAGGTGGAAVLVGPTAGYLAGFVVAAFVIGWLCERGLDRNVGTAVLVFCLGNAIIYLFGVPWLATFTGWDAVWSAGVTPFIAGDIIKIVLAGVALPVAWRVTQDA